MHTNKKKEEWNLIFTKEIMLSAVVPWFSGYTTDLGSLALMDLCYRCMHTCAQYFFSRKMRPVRGGGVGTHLMQRLFKNQKQKNDNLLASFYGGGFQKVERNMSEWNKQDRFKVTSWAILRVLSLGETSGLRYFWNFFDLMGSPVCPFGNASLSKALNWN